MGMAEGMTKGKADGRAEGIVEGRAEGIAEGRAEGIAEGQAEGIGMALQDLLEARFGTLPPSVISCIANTSDSNALRKLTLSAYYAESLQAFIEQMNKDKNRLM